MIVTTSTLPGPGLRERLKAGGLHGVFSGLLLLVALYLVFVLWYPSPLHKAAGVVRIFLLLMGTVVVLGPILTMLVFKKDRRLLRQDIAVILLVQLSAFLYGLHTMAQGRPVWLAFVVDDVEVVRAVDIDLRLSGQFPAEYLPALLTGPRWVAAVYSDNPAVRNLQKQEEIFDGISLARRPETYRPLSTRTAQITSRQHPLRELSRYNADDAIKAALASHPTAAGWLPLKAPELEMVVLLDAKGSVLGIADLRPW